MRNFPDFLTAYLDYARDGFCPDKFHFWAGVSLIAGALERKVWIPFEGGRFIYPNLYIFLLSAPGVGKSSAGNRAVDFMGELTHAEGDINFIPNQVTEAALIKATAAWKKFYLREKEHRHSSAYFYASEASNSLKEISGGGDIFAMLTDFYDCPKTWMKQTVKDGVVTIYNLCFNMLAGCTFNYLKKLFPDDNIAGGFASRILYIVHDEKLIRTPKWPLAPEEETELKTKLLEDLTHIHHLVGSFKATPGYQKAYEEWFPKHDEYVQSLRSERMQAFLARKHTNILKLSMICSVSESDKMILEEHHWVRALGLMDELEQKLPKILDHSAQDTQAGINRMILQTIKSKPDGVISESDLRKLMIVKGIEASKIEHTLGAIQKAGMVKLEIGAVGKVQYRLLVDPNQYL